MNPLAIALAAGVVMLAGAAAGILLRRSLPGHHLNDPSKDVVRLGAGLLATMAALVLGLLITSAKHTYDVQGDEIRQIAAKMVLLDSQLGRFGPEARGARQLQKEAMAPMIDRIWGERDSALPAAVRYHVSAAGDLLYAAIEALAPQNESQRSLKAQALQSVTSIIESRAMLFEQSGDGLPMALLVMLILWLTILFTTFTLFSPVNPTNGAALGVIAFSAAGAIFLILEMNDPFSGLVQLSKAPLREALGVLGR